MSLTLALYNAKGGTGKTTIGINLAGALNTLDYKVLFVDLDPQGNATEALGMPEVYDDRPPTLADFLTGEFPVDRVDGLIQEHPEMDVLPSNVDMLHLERELTILESQGTSPVHLMNNLMETLGSNYDLILLDCPPFFGSISDSAILSAGNIVIPSLAESTSRRAVELLLDQIARLQRDHDVAISELAAVANRVEYNNEAQQMTDWFHKVFDDIPVFVVRKRVAFQRAYSAGTSLLEYDPSCDMCLPFRNMARSILNEKEIAA